MGSEPPKIDDFTVKMTKISPLARRVTTFGSDGSEFLISFGPLRNPTPQIGYPYPNEHEVPQTPPVPSPSMRTGMDRNVNGRVGECVSGVCAWLCTYPPDGRGFGLLRAEGRPATPHLYIHTSTPTHLLRPARRNWWVGSPFDAGGRFDLMAEDSSAWG